MHAGGQSSLRVACISTLSESNRALDGQRPTTHFAIFDITLMWNAVIDEYADSLPAIGTFKVLFALVKHSARNAHRVSGLLVAAS